jgi:hypothetical protein
MNKRNINYLVLSDIHLGSGRNTTTEIITNLRTYFKDNHKLFKKLHLIILAGDIFDKLLASSSDEYILAVEWLTELVQYCKHNKIKLRILEGTPSHDWKQARVVETTIKKLEIEADFKYITTLDIEQNVDLGINILYLPDEYKHNADETFEDVKSLLVEKNLTKVDIAIMHGQFHYQLPIKLESSHTEANWLGIVKFYISIGHIHSSSVNGRILAQGSFDRLAMGEEEAKGGMYIQLFHNGDMEFKFIENENSKLFVTFDYKDKSLEEILTVIDNDLTPIRNDSYVRLLVDDKENIRTIIKPIKDKYNYLHIELGKTDKEEIDITDELTHIEAIESFHITPANIEELLMDEFYKSEHTKEEKDIALKELKDLL